MTAFVVGKIDIHDPDGCQTDLDDCLATLERHGGEILVTSFAKTTELECCFAPPRRVLLQFLSGADAAACYVDPAYQALGRARQKTAHTNLVILDGVSEDKHEKV